MNECTNEMNKTICKICSCHRKLEKRRKITQYRNRGSNRGSDDGDDDYNDSNNDDFRVLVKKLFLGAL